MDLCFCHSRTTSKSIKSFNLRRPKTNSNIDPNNVWWSAIEYLKSNSIHIDQNMIHAKNVKEHYEIGLKHLKVRIDHPVQNSNRVFEFLRTNFERNKCGSISIPKMLRCELKIQWIRMPFGSYFSFESCLHLSSVCPLETSLHLLSYFNPTLVDDSTDFGSIDSITAESTWIANDILIHANIVLRSRNIIASLFVSLVCHHL